MALTNNKKLAEKMGLLRSHGITCSSELMTHEPDGLGITNKLTSVLITA